MHDFQFYDREALEAIQAKEHDYADRKNAIITEIKVKHPTKGSYPLILLHVSVLDDLVLRSWFSRDDLVAFILLSLYYISK